MRTRTLAATLLLGMGCAKQVTLLKISPSGNQTIGGPTDITSDSFDTAWTLTGPGSLSTLHGHMTTYNPPATVSAGAPTTATVTAAANGQTASVTFTIPPRQVQMGTIPGLQAGATVIYDPQQVPHVFCANEVDCLAVQGYLHAQDRLFQMDFFRRAARGSLSSLIGGAGVSQDQQILTVFATRDG